MKLTAIDDETGKPAVIIPIALQDAPGYLDYTALALYDLITGHPIRQFDFDDEGRFHPEWRVMDDNIAEAETITDVYGEDDAEWRAAADAKLSDWGFKLGEFVPCFAFRAGGYGPGGCRYEARRYDGYLLEAA